MKEIGKLIELLNEYEKRESGISNARTTNFAFLYYLNNPAPISELNLISKKYGFIEWLVREDKIERPEIRSQGYTKPTYGYTTEPYTTCKSIELTNTILMILSIKDNPIEFLVSILK